MDPSEVVQWGAACSGTLVAVGLAGHRIVDLRGGVRLFAPRPHIVHFSTMHIRCACSAAPEHTARCAAQVLPLIVATAALPRLRTEVQKNTGHMPAEAVYNGFYKTCDVERGAFSQFQLLGNYLRTHEPNTMVWTADKHAVCPSCSLTPVCRQGTGTPPGLAREARATNAGQSDQAERRRCLDAHQIAETSRRGLTR